MSPRKLYDDLIPVEAGAERDEACGHTVELFDGPAICMRPKGHKVDSFEPFVANLETGSFHQEEFEGWVWDHKQAVS